MKIRFREPVNGITHMVGAAAALIGLILLLIVNQNGGWSMISVLVYGISLILLFSASSIYHSVIANQSIINMLRKFDHCAIYLLIAGSYTPICINAFSGFFRWGLLAIVWSIALIGIIVKIFYMGSPRWLTAGIYVILGWISISAIGEMLAALSPWALGWLISGGIIYTVGAIIYATKLFNFLPGRFGYHEVWHLFVLSGAAAHYFAIWEVITKI